MKTQIYTVFLQVLETKSDMYLIILRSFLLQSIEMASEAYFSRCYVGAKLLTRFLYNRWNRPLQLGMSW